MTKQEMQALAIRYLGQAPLEQHVQSELVSLLVRFGNLVLFEVAASQAEAKAEQAEAMNFNSARGRMKV